MDLPEVVLVVEEDSVEVEEWNAEAGDSMKTDKDKAKNKEAVATTFAYKDLEKTVGHLHKEEEEVKAVLLVEAAVKYVM